MQVVLQCGREGRTGVSAPFVDVKVGQTADEKLEFRLGEDPEGVLRDDLVQALEHGLRARSRRRAGTARTQSAALS